ncbi:maleylacetoacetate isomerase [Thalassotalea mangrovi]|uniref:Maleylacetoacetate isomerase n=1 Tax=Thalassotalea mangrovi TaxID=2572245 RepID=A0A4U1B3W5_9GAMM|nr:maleylacetoacetate isomerase [Thalassotalea mangrovi]TKB44719.1 maleylacetoacetate isomerase [Thalassotalea mangrovi]
MSLYGYWRSSAAYRVRIALNLKQIEHELLSVHLVKDGGQQHSAEYKALNPNELVPTLVDGDFTLNQSMAILDYLEHKYPSPALYPQDLQKRSMVQALANDIACDVHPLNNLRVLNYLSDELSVTAEQKQAWYQHWIQTGFMALEQRLEKTAGLYCFGDNVTMADLCLIPQVYNAKRFNVDLSAFPTILRVDENCQQLDAFKAALPENQPDAT